jgi:hypothetical protein
MEEAPFSLMLLGLRPLKLNRFVLTVGFFEGAANNWGVTIIGGIAV